MQNRQVQKQTGSFYTPLYLAQLLAREVLAQLPRQTPLNKLRILDPAAGEGGLLLPFAQELATLRAQQELGKSRDEILQDILDHQLYGADISATALAKTAIPEKHLYCGNALAERNGKSVLQTLSPGGFDIILANPPYIGQKGHAALFDQLRKNPLWAAYVTPKNDLLYYFFYLALLLLKPGGLAGFITPPYFATAAGGKRLRQTLQKQAGFLRLVNFGDKQCFPGVGQHTLMSIFTRAKTQIPCSVGHISPVPVAQGALFYGPELFLQTLPPGPQQPLLARMATSPYTLGKIARISNGLMTGCDKAFILTDEQKKKLKLSVPETAKLKPFFKNSDIDVYVPNTTPRLWLIDFFYPNDRHLKLRDYPHLLAHLEQFKDKLLARKQNNNGIDKQLAQGHFWFGSVRRKMNFETEKLVLPHRAPAVRAAYSDGSWYASSDVYFISGVEPPYNLWILLGLLNSAPYLAWLKAHGKQKGNLLELYSAPLNQVPVPEIPPAKQRQLETYARALYQAKRAQDSVRFSALQTQLNNLVETLF